jgi:hypothetical protein
MAAEIAGLTPVAPFMRPKRTWPVKVTRSGWGAGAAPVAA